MPGERRTAGTRTRGSWLPRLVGLGVIVVLAGGGTVAYLVGFHPARPQHVTVLPSKVESFNTVGLVAQPAHAAASGQLAQLLSPGGVPGFTPVGQAEAANGHPEWTADLMAGGTYIFIYLPSGQCLAAAGQARILVLTEQHCNLGLKQRWRRLGSGLKQGAHDFFQFANAANGECLTQLSPATGQPGGAGLARCDLAMPASQMLAFWWTVQ
jgi:hypothetical protein